MAVRQRQASKRGDNARPSPRRMSDNRRSSSTVVPMLRRRYFKKAHALALAVFLLIGFIFIKSQGGPLAIGSNFIDSVATGLNLHNPFYVIVIDAGSTASRVLAFGFHNSMLDGQLILDSELFYQLQPGLAAFAKKPKEVEPYLEKLLNKAREVIPPSKYEKTPLSLKATAGLRLLPGHEANDLLDECRLVFNNSGFSVSENSVSIMDASDEGIFSWFTVNYLLGKLAATDAEGRYPDTVGVFDLGGGSTQVTFVMPGNEAEIKSGSSAQYVYNINVFNTNVSVYTRSVLGMGLMAARKEILLHPDNALNEPAVTEQQNRNVDEPMVVHAECINPIISGAEWVYSGKKYLVKGPTNGTHKVIKSQLMAGIDEDAPVVRFKDCFSIIKKVVQAAVPEKLPSLADHEVYTISYYFDRASEAGLIDPFKGGTIKVKSFYKAARQTCDYPNADQPFMCLDLTFIYVLLHDGFGLDDNAQLSLKKKINGHETSWALGAGFSLL